MKELKELVDIIAKNRIKNFEILNNSGPGLKKNDPFLKFYHFIRKDKFKTDKEASMYLYKKPPGTAFWTFKHRLSTKLLNNLFFINTNREGVSEYMKAEIACARNQYFIRVLVLFGGRVTALKICEKLRQKAEKFELTEYAAFAYKIMSIYGSYIGDHDFEKHNRDYEFYTETNRLEEKARINLSRINFQFARTNAQKPDVAKAAFAYATEIKNDIARHATFKLWYHYHKIQGLGFEIAKEYYQSLEQWVALETYMNAHRVFASDVQFGKLALQQMVNYMHLRLYEDAKKSAAKCSFYFKIYGNNWHTFSIFNFLLAMQMEEYDHAGEIFDLAINSPRLAYTIETEQEKWIVFEAYLHFALKGKVKGNRKKFKFSSLHIFDRDKAGFNIAILIIEICALIQSKEEKLIISRIDSLKLYKSRYLGKATDVNYRVNVFMELLFELAKANYKPKDLTNKSNLLLKKLEATSIQYSDNIEGIEVIQFERLWEMITE